MLKIIDPQERKGRGTLVQKQLFPCLARRSTAPKYRTPWKVEGLVFIEGGLQFLMDTGAGG